MCRAPWELTASEEKRRESIETAHAANRIESAKVTTRQCTKCKEYKHIEFFYQQKTYTKKGVPVYRPMSWCRRCVRKYQKAKRNAKSR